VASPNCERAIFDATRVGGAILKFISPNDVGTTGGHQCGYYLPKAAWKMFTEHAPRKGENKETEVEITWQDDSVTHSRVKWYGKGTRSEYRLTRFGLGFPYLTADCVGDLLVLIPLDHTHFLGYVLDSDADVEELEAALGVQITETWAAYQRDEKPVENEDDCVDRRFRKFAEKIEEFPTGTAFSVEARNALIACVKGFTALTPDDLLMRCMDTEYALFKLVERQLCQGQIYGSPFKDVDAFLRVASSIMNRRKARAGRSLENHVSYVLKESRIPHAIRPKNLEGEPDIIIPSAEAYLDPKYPVEKLIFIGIKTTCKDRWRQVLNEAGRIPEKHILTIQQGISAKQLAQMHTSHVTLIVPKKLHRQYPKGTPITLLDVESFVEGVKARLS
jgi:hypothetical protein